MTQKITARFLTRDSPCPICQGYDRAMRGQGIRCAGYQTEEFICCTREEFAGGLPQNAGGAYAHLLEGACKCGVTHNASRTPISHSRRAKVVERYDYRDAQGKLVYQVERREPKGFMQRRPDGRGGWTWNMHGVSTLLYRLPELLRAIDAGDPVHVCEGERDVHALEHAGAVATCNSGGAGKFRPEYGALFRGADVTIVQDKDPACREHGAKVYKALRAFAVKLRIVEAATGKDASDHLLAGKGLHEFVPVASEDEQAAADPLAAKRRIIRASLEIGDPFRVVTDFGALARSVAAPTWTSGIDGISPITEFQGFTLVSGGPGAGKSFLAVASSVSAAIYGGWHALYLNAEMPAVTIARRVSAYLRGIGLDPEVTPERWELIDVRFGADLPRLIELIASRVTEDRMLVVFDSITSFIDQGLIATEGSRDTFGVSALKRLAMWALNVTSALGGEISFLALGETNRSGQSFGRFVDHKAHLSLVMTKDDIDPSRVKHLEVVKGWSAEIGTRARLELDWSSGRLTAERDGPRYEN